MGGRTHNETINRRAAALLAVGLCILLAVPAVAGAVPAVASVGYRQLQLRHGDDDADENEHDHASHGEHQHHNEDPEENQSHGGTHDHHDVMDMPSGSSAPTASAPISSSSAVSPDSAAHHDMSEPHGPPPDHHHSHGSHAAAKVELNDAEIHYWHSFPPSYLAADFRLTNDSVIFGEELPAEWDPETASGHKGLMVLHVVFMCMAYFAVLPIGMISGFLHPHRLC